MHNPTPMRFISALLILLVPATSISAQTTPVKKVLLEEFTTTLCGFCPPKSKEIIQFHEANPTNTLFMTHHAGFGTDSMTNAQASAFAQFFSPATFGFAPAIMIDRDVYPWVDSIPYMSVNGFDTIATTVMQQPAIVGIDFSGSYNVNTRKLTITVSSEFTQTPPAGDYRLNVFFVEDSVLGSGNGWDQKCYDANWANTNYPGQYNASTTYISGYPHRYVQRGPIGGGTWGPTGIIPTNPVAGTSYDYYVTVDVPLNFNENMVSLIAFVARYGTTKLDRHVLNANNIKLTDLSTSSSLNEIAEEPAISLYPNPASDQIEVLLPQHSGSEFEMILADNTGKMVEVKTVSADQEKRIRFSCAHLANGNYQVILRNRNEVYRAPLIKLN